MTAPTAEISAEIVTQTADAAIESAAVAAPVAQPAPPAPTLAGIAPRAFWTAKAGNAAGDYEDAWEAGSDCLAIADGATESSFSRLWAQGLCAGFARAPSALFPLRTERTPDCVARLQAWVQPLQQAWHAGVAWDKLPWFAEDKARSGAFATLLLFQLLTGEGEGESPQNAALPFNPPRPWQCAAIGDSCLFQIRDSQLKTAFPLTHSSQFDSRPVLLCSNPINNKRVWEDIVITEGTLQTGDILLFATDALSRWFLAECEAGNMPWHALCALNTPEEFEAFVARLRQERRMRNDDVTLVIVDASGTTRAMEESQDAAAGSAQTDDRQTPAPPVTVGDMATGPESAAAAYVSDMQAEDTGEFYGEDAPAKSEDFPPVLYAGAAAPAREPAVQDTPPPHTLIAPLPAGEAPPAEVSE